MFFLKILQMSATALSLRSKQGIQPVTSRCVDSSPITFVETRHRTNLANPACRHNIASQKGFFPVEPFAATQPPTGKEETEK